MMLLRMHRTLPISNVKCAVQVVLRLDCEAEAYLIIILSRLGRHVRLTVSEAQLRDAAAHIHVHVHRLRDLQGAHGI